MRGRDFSRTCGFLQMLINTLYLLNMRYGTDPMTQFWAKCEKPRFWANFDIIMLIMRKQDFFSKIGLRHFSPLTSEQLHAKNLRDPMVGSIITFVTDRHQIQEMVSPRWPKSYIIRVTWHDRCENILRNRKKGIKKGKRYFPLGYVIIL